MKEQEQEVKRDFGRKDALLDGGRNSNSNSIRTRNKARRTEASRALARVAGLLQACCRLVAGCAAPYTLNQRLAIEGPRLRRPHVFFVSVFFRPSVFCCVFCVSAEPD